MPTAPGETTVIVGVGYVGRRLLAALPEDASIGLSRSGRGTRGRLQHLDLDADESRTLSFDDDYSIVYTVPPSRHDDDDIRLKRLLGMLATPPRRIVYLSTTGVYGDRRGARIDETTEPRPESQRAVRRVNAEQALHEFCKRQQCELVVLRVPGIYGAGRLGVDRIRDGQPVLAEADANPGNRIHVDDLVRCCVAALDDAVPAGIYNVGDGDERSSTWFANEVARQLGLDPPPTVDRKTAERTFSSMRLSFLKESRRLDLTRMQQLLGITAIYSNAADGIAASLSDKSS